MSLSDQGAQVKVQWVKYQQTSMKNWICIPRTSAKQQAQWYISITPVEGGKKVDSSHPDPILNSSFSEETLSQKAG